MERREHDVPPMMPSMYPIPEYRPSTPQSDAQPEMVETVKTYTRPFFREPQTRVEEKRKREGRCQCVRLGGEAGRQGGCWTTSEDTTHRNDGRKFTGLSPRPILKKARRKSVSCSCHLDPGNTTHRQGRNDIARRTFGGMPLITGINRIYKNKATVKRPDRAEAPTNGLQSDRGSRKLLAAEKETKNEPGERGSICI